MLRRMCMSQVSTPPRDMHPTMCNIFRRVRTGCCPCAIFVSLMDGASNWIRDNLAPPHRDICRHLQPPGNVSTNRRVFVVNARIVVTLQRTEEGLTAIPSMQLYRDIPNSGQPPLLAFGKKLQFASFHVNLQKINRPSYTELH